MVSRTAKIAATLAAGYAAYDRFARPWHLTWGTTSEEAHATLPGDEVVPDPVSQSTHAVTVDAPPEAVWPWVVQLGYGRGGFYSYTQFENAAGRVLERTGVLDQPMRMENADRILPDYQDVREGDHIPFGPQPGPTMRVHAVEPERALVLVADRETAERMPGGPPGGVTGAVLSPSTVGTWAFILRPRGADATRLITRTRGDRRPGLAPVLSDRLLWEPAHFIMDRRMLLGIKERAERSAATREVTLEETAEGTEVHR